ncbi:hypothetical protein CDAR_164411 [Caerostris darwini]|uniref:Uncharacterized protein n=1 Tax=Caerostris darwini TaxID=1538125 RepID=A0AAV4V787_9ARAC|nr:hypothetical protein CDAR_164411 [Caerostris darwini]
MTPKTKGHGEFITSSTTEVGRCIDMAEEMHPRERPLSLVRWASVKDGRFFVLPKNGNFYDYLVINSHQKAKNQKIRIEFVLDDNAQP